MSTGVAVAAVSTLVQDLADVHACAAGLVPRPVFAQREAGLLPDQWADALRAVAFDARTVADVEALAPQVTTVRRLLGAQEGTVTSPAGS